MPLPQDQHPEAPAAEEILEGGPGHEDAPEESPDASQEAPQYVQVRVNGKTLTVTQDVADAILEREESFQRKLSEQGTELGHLRKQTRPPEPEASPEDEDLQFYQSPSRAITSKLQAMREEVKAELRQEYEIDNARREWWGQFYKENPTLVGKEKLVGAVLAQEFEAIKELEPNKARKVLADSINQTIRVAAPKPTTKTTLSNRPATTERSSGSPSTPAPAAEPDTAYGLSATLKARAQARRQARLGKK